MADRFGVGKDTIARIWRARNIRIIAAAALIMVLVFASFMLEHSATVKILGLGLAAAVAIGATVVRMLLVSAIMELLGDKNWWIPRWLDRILPNLVVEPTRLHRNPERTGARRTLSTSPTSLDHRARQRRETESRPETPRGF